MSQGEGSSNNVEEYPEEDKKIRVQISEKDLLCVNGCGFYGTPQWGNRCSKCWRVHQIMEKRNQDYAKNRTLLSFDSFQERRRLSTDTRTSTIKKIFKSSSITGGSSHQPASPPTPVRPRPLSPDSAAAREHLSNFLVTKLPQSLVQDVSKQTKHAVLRIHELRLGADEMSDLVQQFYQYVLDRIKNHPFFSDPSHEITAEMVVEEVEQYICICCYDDLFCSNSDEEVADLSLQHRIRSLHWVTSGFLETKIDFSSQNVRDHLDDAITEMIDINSRRPAKEKLSCLVRCSHKIFEALKESAAPTSADEFLPVLIYVLLKGNPPLIQSNLKFISRFALPSRVMSGESGYFFTNLSCAMQFVQDMNHESLRMGKQEFEAYTSGDLVPPLSLMNCGCNMVLSSMEKSLKRLTSLLDKQVKLEESIDKLDTKIKNSQTDIPEQIATLSAYPTEKYKLLVKEIEEESLEDTTIAKLVLNATPEVTSS